MSRSVLVLPSPPTANGDLHLGHLAGPYLAADAFARYRRMRGDDVAYVTGADVHQSYVVRMAERNATTPQETADAFAWKIEDTLRAAHVEVDAFVRPHRSYVYPRFVSHFFRELRAKGHIDDVERPVLWCSLCSRYLLGAAVRGSCAGCGLGTDGALCEHCGRPVQPNSLRQPCCTRCGSPATLRPMRRLHFSVGRFAGQLREYHSVARMRSHGHAIVESLLAEGLFEAPITSPSTWGVPVPVPGFDDQRFEVWAEVGPGYPASTMEATKGRGNGRGWETYWRDDAQVVQFFGIDNTVPHTLLYPALYFAHGRIRPPDHFVINRFHRLDGQKFSTSRQHAVWAGHALAHVPVDALRYYLALTASEEEEDNFTVSEFRETVNRDLFATIGPLLDEAVREAASLRPLPLGGGDRLLDDLRRGARALGERLEAETFSLREAIRTWRRMASTIASAHEGARDTATRPPARPSTDGARPLVQALSLLASCAHPIMPGFASRLWTAIGGATDLSNHAWGEPVGELERRVDPPPAGTWFPEITDEHAASLTLPRVGV